MYIFIIRVALDLPNILKCRDGGIRTHDLADPNGARWPGCATSRITVVIITVGFLFDKPNVKRKQDFRTEWIF